MAALTLKPIVCRTLKLPVAFVIPVLAALLSGCGGSPRIEPAPRLPSVNGSITLEGGAALAPTAVLTVRLVELARADASRIVVEQIISNPGAFPYHFRLFYREAALDYAADYGIEALVSDGGRTVWVQAQPTPVLTKGRPQVVAIVLQRAP